MNVELASIRVRYLGEARGLLFLIDPLRIPAVAHDPRISLTEKERRVPAADYLNDARKLATFFRRVPVHVPLAVCLNKLDRWGKLLPPGTTLREWACGVPDPNQPGLDRIIHDEVAATLSKWGANGFLEDLEVNFPEHRFFACSALGDAATPLDDQAQPLPTPLLVDARFCGSWNVKACFDPLFRGPCARLRAVEASRSPAESALRPAVPARSPAVSTQCHVASALNPA